MSTFTKKLEDGLYYERTFERGVEGFTLACGTGTGSLISILTLKGEKQWKRHQSRHARRKTNRKCREKGWQNRNLYLRGGTNVVCKGEVTDENIKGLVSTCEI